MRKALIFLLISTICVSCNRKESPENKSVFEPLTVRDLSYLSKRDTLYIQTYEQSMEINDYITKNTDKAKFYDITHKNVYDAFKLFEKMYNAEYKKAQGNFKDTYNNYQAIIKDRDSILYEYLFDYHKYYKP